MKILRKIILVCILSGFFGIQISAQKTTLKSPDGNYLFTFEQKNNANGNSQMYYTLAYKGKTVIEESELGIFIDNHLIENAMGIPQDKDASFCENMKLIDTARDTFNETWKPVYGERNEYQNHYNEVILKFQKEAQDKENAAATDDGYVKRKAYFLNLIVRAYNEGVAFRYAFPEATNGLFMHITGEQTQFTLPEGTLAYYAKWAQAPYSLLPLKDWTDECERPLTLKLTNGLTVALGEAEMTDYARMKFSLNKEKANTLQASLYDSVDIITPYETPWRVVMAAEKPGELVMNNNILLNLNPPCQIEDVSWIKPGKVFRSGLTQEDAKRSVDFAAERGLQYIHLDAGWYGKEFLMSSDATKVDSTKNLNIPELVKYAESKGIGLLLYVNQRALSRQLDDILPLYKKWGVKGIKFGFVQVGSQLWTTWMHNAVKKCAEYGLMVDIHDEYRPTGFSRTYPNLMTQEGIRGNEEMPDATHNTILPFTRYLAGAGDYTICYYSNRIKTTHAHQLALAAVYYSPLQFIYWYDLPRAYQGEPEVEFFDRAKTVWDDTKVIDGQIGEYVITARRSSNEWFVGAITNNDARKVEIPLAFLEKGKKYTATVYYDDNEVKTRTKVGIKKLQVTDKTILTENLQASGGVAVLIENEK